MKRPHPASQSRSMTMAPNPPCPECMWVCAWDLGSGASPRQPPPGLPVPFPPVLSTPLPICAVRRRSASTAVSCSSHRNSTLKESWHLHRDNSKLIFPAVNPGQPRIASTWAKDTASTITCSGKAGKPHNSAKCCSTDIHSLPPPTNTHTLL